MAEQTYNYIEVDQSGKVTGACRLTAPVTKGGYIETETYDPDVIGKIYDPEKGTFSEAEAGEAEQEQEIDPDTITDSEFKTLVLEKLGFKIKKE